MWRRKDNVFDVVMRHSEAKEYVKEHGYDAFVQEVDKDFGYKLSGASMYWEHDRNYICKMRGGRGDVIIGWEENVNEEGRNN